MSLSAHKFGAQKVSVCWWRAPVQRSLRCSLVAVRSASGEAAPITSRASSPWPRRCAPPIASEPPRTQGCRVARFADRRPARRTRRRPRDRRTASTSRGCARLHRRRRERSAAVSPRRSRVCASAASSCASGAMEPSHVLAAMGIPDERARGALRLTLGRTTTADDIASQPPRSRVRPPVAQGTRSMKVLVALMAGSIHLWPCRIVDAAITSWASRCACGEARATPLLFGRRCRRCSPRRTATRHRPLWCQLLRRVQQARGRSICASPQSRSDAQPLHRMYRHLKFDRLSERADLLGFDAIATVTTPASGALPIVDSFIAALMPQRTRATSCTCCRNAKCAARCFRWGHSPRRRSATGGCARSPNCREARQPGRVLHHQTGGRETFLGSGSRSEREPSSTRQARSWEMCPRSRW